MKKIALVSVSYNQKETTNKLISLLKKQKNADDFDIIIVDNGSTDGTYNYLKSEHKDIVILKTNKNYGYSGGSCIGMMYAYDKGYNYIILTDNDAFPVSKNLISELIKNCNENTVSCPIWIENDERIKSKEEIKIVENSAIWIDGKKRTKEEVNVAVPFLYLCLHREIIKRVGFPYFHYFLYYDDAEYVRKIYANGIKIVKVPATMSHPKLVSILPLTRYYFIFRNQFLYYLRNDSFFKYLLKSFFSLNSFLVYLIYGQKELAKYAFLGFKNFLINNFRVKPYLIPNRPNIAFKKIEKKELKMNDLFAMDLTLTSQRILGVPNSNNAVLDRSSIKEFILFFKRLIKEKNKNLILDNLHLPKVILSSLFFKNIYLLDVSKSSKEEIFVFKIKNRFRFLKISCISILNIILGIPLFVILTLKYLDRSNLPENITDYRKLLF